MNLEQRVAALEALTTQLAGHAGAARTSARRWRLAAIGSALALVGGAGIAANQARQIDDVITASTIEIVNGDDDVVMELTSDSAGGILNLYNNDGDLVGCFEVYEEGGRLSVKNNDEDDMAIIRCDEFGGIFAVNNADNSPAASMEVDVAGGIISVRSNDDPQVGAMMDIIGDGGRVFVNSTGGREREVKP